MLRIEINGIVQGVGFRPFVFNLANNLNLKGYVLNSNDGIEVEAEGSNDAIEAFIQGIQTNTPRAAKIDQFSLKILPDNGYNVFEIRQSKINTGSTHISPDLAICSDCIRELENPNDYRYKFPFINCTNCGPRYSIIEKTPYDRPTTSMKNFYMCEYCRNEYNNPGNRRFHAQPIACHQCGPELNFLDNKMNPLSGDPIDNCLSALNDGKIVGIKGVGGFHIACDATNEKAVIKLRKRKDRPAKPFALMCSLNNVLNIVECSPFEIHLLQDSAAPIVLLAKTKQSILAKSVAPHNPYLGIMIPYAPHQYQLFKNQDLYLVMTSGNINDDPIAIDERKLTSLCDFFLTHNRPILNRNDDSVMMPVNKGKNILLRRSRGYIPTPLSLPFNTIPTLGTGAEMKLTFALTNNRSVYVSPYIGNNNNKETEDFYKNTIKKYRNWFNIVPQIAACDLHPDYFTTHYAETLNIPIIKTQHHHAHIAAIMAEYALDEAVIGISYDGSGYGDDGAIWGGEIFIADYCKYYREFHLNYMPLAGGDVSIKYPKRIAFTYLSYAREDNDFLPDISKLEEKVISQQITNNFNIYQTSSMGRLFDCVSAMIGIFTEISFEAQSAMALEFLCGKESLDIVEPYPYTIANHEINIIPLIKEIKKDILNHTSKNIIALKFHKTIINFSVEAVNIIAQKTGLSKVVLSGGVMQNRVLLQGLFTEMQKNNMKVYYASSLPANDGSVSVGQAIIANKIINNHKSCL